MQFAAAAMQPSPRTLDVLSGTKSFAGLLLPPAIEQALREAGFLRPSPVQEAALPLARMGTDLIVQAKAGTGKTLVFAVAAVERVDLTNSAPQVGSRRIRVCGVNATNVLQVSGTLPAQDTTGLNR